MIYPNDWKIVKWLRKEIFKIEKPVVAPARRYDPDDETWEDWDERVKEEYPLGYFLTESLPDFIQNIYKRISKPINGVRHYWVNRYMSKFHYLPTGLEPGKYYELDTRILHGLFESLVDFVESEKAWMTVIFDADAQENFKLPWYERYWILRWGKKWRNPAAGLAHLEWEMALTIDESLLGNREPSIEEAKVNGSFGQPTRQAVSAREQFDLYKWWKEVRPNRIDPWDEYHIFSKKMDEIYGKKKSSSFCDEYLKPEEKKEKSRLFQLVSDIEESYEKEDEEMLIRLIKIRQSLWT